MDRKSGKLTEEQKEGFNVVDVLYNKNKKTNRTYMEYMDSFLHVYSNIDTPKDEKEMNTLMIAYAHEMRPLERAAATTKLMEDGYLTLKEDKYQITMAGFMFINGGGYTQQQKDIESERFKTKLSNVLIAGGAGIAGVYYLFKGLIWFANLFIYQ